jgi:hypothetical protein
MTLRTIIKFRDNREPMQIMESYEEAMARCKEITYPNLLIPFRAYEPDHGEVDRAVILGDIKEIIRY